MVTTGTVWVSYPLKQGLKLELEASWIRSGRGVWVSYPLKQGLKLTADPLLVDVSAGLSQLSIKTRIETAYLHGYAWNSGGLSQLSIKTRIETIL